MAEPVDGRSIFLLPILLIVAAHAAPVETDLGTPVKSMTIWGRLLVTDRETGRPVLYAGTYTGAGWARLIRFDYATNATEYYTVEGCKGAYGLCEGEDGSIYIGTVQPGRIFRFDPSARRLENLGAAAGEEFVWTLKRGPQGRIYGATYPNAKVVMYDLSDGKIHDLGRMHPTEQYCRDLAVAENGRIFCGIGSHADLIAYDPTTHEKRSILPERYKNNSFAYTVEAEGNTVYVFLHFDEIVLIFDAETYELLKEVRSDKGPVTIHRQRSGGPVLIYHPSQGYLRFNKTTMSLEPVSVPSYGLWDPESNIAFTATSQYFAAYNLTDGRRLAWVDVAKDGEGMSIFSLGGVYNLLHLFRYCPSTGILKDLGNPVVGSSGEFYSFLSYQGKLYMASYTYAVLTVYDPSRPWSPGTDPESNPRKIGPVGEEQYRPPAMVAAADGRIYIGTIPAYGKLGGALSAFDPRTDAFEVHRNIIPNQSIISLCTSPDGWILYGGSSVRGGGGAEPVEKSAHFFAWDVRSGDMIFDTVPFPRTGEIQCLATDKAGVVYGFAGSNIFVYDPRSRSIVYKGSSPVGNVKRLVLGPDGYFYGISPSALFRMRPMSSTPTEIGFQTLARGGADIALGTDGTIYFARRTDLYRLDNVPSLSKPAGDEWIYRDGLCDGWQIQGTRAQIDNSWTERVPEGACQKISFERLCLLQYVSPDPWRLNPWMYTSLKMRIDLAGSRIEDLVISKTGAGSGRSLSLLRDLNLTLSPDGWNDLEIPVGSLGWGFGSQLESLKITVLGSGTIYVDDMRLAIQETQALSASALLAASVFCFALSRTRAQWRTDASGPGHHRWNRF